MDRKEECFRIWNSYEERRYKELLDTEEYRELERKASFENLSFEFGSAFQEMMELQDNAWRQAHREAEGTQAYKEWLDAEDREENARAALLPEIRDYQNGHCTYFDRNGDVIGEDIA